MTRGSGLTGLLIVALLATACSPGSGESATGGGDQPREPLRIRVVINSNPASADRNAALELRAVALEGEQANVVHEQLLTAATTNAEIDVYGADGLDLLVAGRHAVAIPRHFWAGMSSGRLVIRIQPGGIELTRRVEPTGQSRSCSGNAKGTTCWSTERWFFEVPLWDVAETAAVKVVVDLRGLDAAGLVLVRLHADDITGPVLAETTTAEKKWEATVSIDPDATLAVVVDDRRVLLPPDLWQLAWKTVRVEFTTDAATFRYQRPVTARRIDDITEPLAVDPIPSENSN